MTSIAVHSHRKQKNRFSLKAYLLQQLALPLLMLGGLLLSAGLDTSI